MEEILKRKVFLNENFLHLFHLLLLHKKWSKEEKEHLSFFSLLSHLTDQSHFPFFYFSFLSTPNFQKKQNTMLFNVSNASVFKKEGGVEKEVKSENCEHQLSFILKVGKNEIWRMEITPPNYSISPFSVFSHR